jgi:transcriptional regulator
MVWYQPQHFIVEDRDILLDAMRAHPFATLVSASDAEVDATHLPLVVERKEGGLRLLGHVARANPHWSRWRAGQLATAIFHGPNAYVAPAWYGARAAVPTWNYIAVHARGRIEVTHDSADKEGILKALIDRHDPAYRLQWDELDDGFREKMKGAIVGLSIAVEQLEGKFKLSQNRVPADQYAVRRAHADGDPGARELADWMQRLGIGSAD